MWKFVIGFGTPRRTEIVEGDEDADRDDLIEREDMVVTLTRGGYVKAHGTGCLSFAAAGRKGAARRWR